MNSLLLLLLVFGLGSIFLSAYVFTVAARNYVSREEDRRGRNPDYHVVRARPGRRQQQQPVQFPLYLDGVVISEDRRKSPERRAGWHW